MSQDQAVTYSQTDTAPLDFSTETLQDLDVGSSEAANVKGGAGIVAAPSPNPGGIRMTGTSVIQPHTTSVIMPGGG